LIIALLAGTFGMILLVVGIIVFVVFHQKRMLKTRIALKELESNYRKELLYTTIKSQDSERERIAKDLHDEVGGILSALKLNLENAIIQSKTGKIDKEPIEEAKGILAKAIPALRLISQDLLPVTLKKFGLSEAIKELCSTHQHPVSVKFHEEGKITRFSSGKELNIYRIIQELINNSIKHSQANDIQVSLRWKTNEVVAEVKDNGIGFDPGLSLTDKNALGLYNIYSRATASNASFKIKSEKNGTTAIISIRTDEES